MLEEILENPEQPIEHKIEANLLIAKIYTGG
jgi:hypothetical protein